MKKCLIVVDYQNDFVSGALGFPEAVALAPCIVEKINEFRQSGDEIIFTLDTHGEDYAKTQEGQKLPVSHCLQGSEGHALYGEVASLALPTDKQLIKHTFGSDALYAYLKTTPFACIELVGVVSNICVMANAVLAKTAQPDTPVRVDARCTASSDSALHRATLDVLAGMQVEVYGRES